jgi:multiple sugar transport system substrate-binding protein
MDGPRSRRDFLRLAVGGSAAVVVGSGCASGGTGPERAATAPTRPGRPTLRIAQFHHFVPAYDAWFDNEYAPRWGERNGVDVIVDHLPQADLPSRAAAEVAAGAGHDIFSLLNGAAGLEDQVIDHQTIVEEVQSKVGPVSQEADRTTYNPKTKKRFAFPDYLAAWPVHYRTDLWGDTGLRPDNWDSVLKAAPALLGGGHPLGLSFSGDADGNYGLNGLLASYGASIQDESGILTINRPATVEALKMGAALFRAGMTNEVLGWDASGSSNNRFLASGRASMIVNAVSALRAITDQDPALAERIALLPAPSGPVARHGCYSSGAYVIWRFSKNQETARHFLADLAVGYREAFVESGFYNLPAFPGAVPDLALLLSHDDRAKPPDAYALLGETSSWSTNLGQPGYDNGAIAEVFDRYLIPQMFAAAARGDMTPEEAVKAAEGQMKPIYDKWREQGKI